MSFINATKFHYIFLYRAMRARLTGSFPDSPPNAHLGRSLKQRFTTTASINTAKPVPDAIGGTATAVHPLPDRARRKKRTVQADNHLHNHSPAIPIPAIQTGVTIRN